MTFSSHKRLVRNSSPRRASAVLVFLGDGPGRGAASCREADAVAAQGGAAAAAAVMPADDDVLHLEHIPANCITDRQFRSVCTTTLAMLRWTKQFARSRFHDFVRGHRLSEQPIHKYSATACRESLGKNSGSRARMASAQARFCAKSDPAFPMLKLILRDFADLSKPFFQHRAGADPRIFKLICQRRWSQQPASAPSGI